MKSSVGIVLFFLLGGFFLSALLAAIERSKKMLGLAALLCAICACVLVFLTPVRLPSLTHANGTTATTNSAITTTTRAR